MKHSLTADTISERDAAWYEELAGTVARGRAALLALQAEASSARHTALSLIAATDAGGPSEVAVGRLLATRPGADVGATALVLVALARSGNAARQRCHATVHAALNVLLAAQNRDGGWPAFVRDTTADPSCPAVTASVLEALGAFGFRPRQPPIDATVKYVLARQAEGGEWMNGCGADALQSTWQVIAGLQAVGIDVFSLPVRRAVRWVKESQNEDAGWGGSTASETAWAVLALLAAGEGESAEARAGAEFLVGTQHADGTWGEDAVTAFALAALGRYLNERTTPVEPRKVLVRTHAGHRLSGPKSYRHTLAEM